MCLQCIEQILGALTKNLEQQAKTYKGYPALASLFLLNNFHHIRNTVVYGTALHTIPHKTPVVMLLCMMMMHDVFDL
jgi:hypothetical protein